MLCFAFVLKLDLECNWCGHMKQAVIELGRLGPLSGLHLAGDCRRDVEGIR
jgi:hypothetical protein